MSFLRIGSGTMRRLPITSSFMPVTAQFPVGAYNACIALLIAIVFSIDLMTPVGSAEWVLYVLPTALCVFARQRPVPLIVAAVCCVLLMLGFFLSPVPVEPGKAVSRSVGAINRTLGGVTIWILAITAFFMIRSRLQIQRFNWLQAGETQLAQEMLGENSPELLGSKILTTLTRYVDARAGALYCVYGSKMERLAAWAPTATDMPPATLPLLASGLLGQAVMENRVLTVRDLPQDYLRIGSGLGSAAPAELLIVPLSAEGRIVAVVELGFVGSTTSLEDAAEFVKQVGENIGMSIRSTQDRQRLQELLEETQRQSEELQTQQEELQVSNEELEEQTRLLRESQERLELQQTELEQTNVHLEEQTQNLENQKQALLAAQVRLTENAHQLDRANRYKSEFLANMSHELRTPLNSSLILAKLLADNKPGNLSADQVRYAQTIHSTNTELLTLINEILDLAKIESGHAEVQPDEVAIVPLLEGLERSMRPLAEQKKLKFVVDRAPGVPRSLITDPQRLQQVLRNLLSNALKFTDKGEITLRVSPVDDAQLAFEVRDTGIGIPEDQQEIIFEAFMQADGTTSRKYGGTGLGLSISRQLASLLRGSISLSSEVGRGSVFRLVVPLRIEVTEKAEPAPQSAFTPAPPPVAPVVARSAAVAAAEADDDRHKRTRGDRLILIVEDDLAFARILYELVHDLDFDAVLAASAADALALAREMQPCGVLLDVGLPDDSGLSVLDRLKRDPKTRHIPVHMISVLDHAETALQLGAVGYTLKPSAREELEQAVLRLQDRLQRRMRRILIVEDDPTLRETMSLLLRENDIEIVGAGTVADALTQLSSTTFDCVVMDLMLPDGSGYDLLQSMAESGRYAFPPVIVYTGRSLSLDDEQKLRRFSKSIIIKGAKSPERLLNEVTLFLHSVESELPEDRQRMLREARERDAAFEGRRLLLAEDDVRNIFALSQVIEPLGAKLEIARNGREALDLLERDSSYDLVLMDIMMPEMDGLTAMREIRRKPKGGDIPIIALTAKAMPEDRQRCLEAGANDYIAKPIDIDKLLSLCRVWLRR